MLTITCTISKLKGVYLMKKMPTHVFGPLNLAILDKWGCTKSELKGGIFYENYLVYLGPHVAGHFGQIHSCRPTKYGLIKCFDHF